MTASIIAGLFALAAVVLAAFFTTGTRTNWLMSRIATGAIVLKDLPEDIEGREVVREVLERDLQRLHETLHPAVVEPEPREPQPEIVRRLVGLAVMLVLASWLLSDPESFAISAKSTFWSLVDLIQTPFR